MPSRAQLATTGLNVASGALLVLSPAGSFTSSNAGGTTLTQAQGTIRLTSGKYWLGNANTTATIIAMSPGGLLDLSGGSLSNDYANANWSGNRGSLNIAVNSNFDMRNNNVVVDALTGNGTIFDNAFSNQLDRGRCRRIGHVQRHDRPGRHDIEPHEVAQAVETLTGANTYTGGTTINGGTLSIANVADSGTSNISPSGTLTFGGGELFFTGASGSTGRADRPSTPAVAR